MKNSAFLSAAMPLLILLAAAACSAQVKSPTSSASISSASIPTLAAEAASGPTSVVLLITKPVLQPTSAGDAAGDPPICQASNSCAALNAEQIPLTCVKKVPYTNVLIPMGTTFDVIDKTGDFSCIDSGIVQNGKEVITCHGKELYSFQLLLSNPACSDATLATGTGECQHGYGYNAAQKCCAAVNPGTGGATTVSVNLGACPLPNP